jgi:hypothetical protein
MPVMASFFNRSVFPLNRYLSTLKREIKHSIRYRFVVVHESQSEWISPFWPTTWRDNSHQSVTWLTHVLEKFKPSVNSKNMQGFGLRFSITMTSLGEAKRYPSRRVFRASLESVPQLEESFLSSKSVYYLATWYHCGRSPEYTGYGTTIDSPKPFVPDEIEGWLDCLSPLLNLYDKRFWWLHERQSKRNSYNLQECCHLSYHI